MQVIIYTLWTSINEKRLSFNIYTVDISNSNCDYIINFCISTNSNISYLISEFQKLSNVFNFNSRCSENMELLNFQRN